MSIGYNRKQILEFPHKYGASSASCVHKWLTRVSTLTGIEQRIRHYIDEETKYASQSKRLKENDPNEQLPQVTKDYPEHKRHTFVRGFFISEIQKKTGKSPHLLEPEYMLREVCDIWKAGIKKHQRRKGDATMHNAVIALKPEFCHLLRDSGQDVDTYLLDLTSKSMRKLEGYILAHRNKIHKKFNQPLETKDDVKIAYVVGIHHDRQHIHAHISIFPYTANGEFIKLASDKKRGYDAYGVVRDYTRKYALDKFKRELYMPAYMIEQGQDKQWQKNLIVSKVFSDATNRKDALTDGAIAESLYTNMENIGNLPSGQFHEKLSEAYDWAENRFNQLKSSRVTKDDLKETQDNLKDLEAQAKEISRDLPPIRKEVDRLKDLNTTLDDEIQQIRGAQDDFPYPGKATNPEKDKEVKDALYGIAFDDEESPEAKAFEKFIQKIFDDLAKKRKRFSVIEMVKDLLKNLFMDSTPKERKQLKQAAADRYKPEDTPEKELLLDKLEKRKNDIEQRIASKEDEIYNKLDTLRILSHRHTALTLDAYLQNNIIQNKKPLLFAPQIKEALLHRDGDKESEDIHTALMRIRENDTSIRNTPEAIFGKINKAVKIEDVKENLAAEPVTEAYLAVESKLASIQL